MPRRVRRTRQDLLTSVAFFVAGIACWLTAGILHVVGAGGSAGQLVTPLEGLGFWLTMLGAIFALVNWWLLRRETRRIL